VPAVPISWAASGRIYEVKHSLESSAAVQQASAVELPVVLVCVAAAGEPTTPATVVCAPVSAAGQAAAMHAPHELQYSPH
jgi:hypothetical protein